MIKRPSLILVEKSRRAVYRGKPREAVLGDGTGNIYAPDGRYYCRWPGPADENGNATYSARFSVFGGGKNFVTQNNRRVYIVQNHKGQLEIDGAVWEDLQAAGIKPSVMNPNEPRRQFTRFDDMQNFKAIPLSKTSMKVRVGELFYVDRNGLPQWFPGTIAVATAGNPAVHVDLTAHIPATTDYECFALISFNQDDWALGDNPLEVSVSTAQSSLPSTLGIADIQEAYAGMSDYALPVKAFRLVQGMTGLKGDPKDLEGRQLINVPIGINALSPLTTKGDLFAYSTLNTRLPVGTNGQVLTADSGEATGLKWDDAASDVTSVALSMPTGVFDVSGSPGTGAVSLVVAFDTQTANTGFYGPPAGSPADPTFRAMVTDDIGQIIEFDNLTTNMREISANDPTVLDDGPDGKLWQRNSAGFENWWILNHHDAFAAPIWLRIGRVVTVLTSTNFLSVTNGSNGQSTITPVSAAANLFVGTPDGSSGPVSLRAIANADIPSTLSGKTLTTPTIGDFSNATHNHSNAAGGGNITGAAFGTQTANTVLSGPTSGGAANPTFRALGLADVPNLVAIFRDEKTSGTAGGSSAATTWNARDLNTELYDPGSIVSIASNQFTPIAGDYEILVFTPFIGNLSAATFGRCRLYNVTGAASVEEGMSTSALTNGPATAVLQCKFTANGSDAYRVDTYTSLARATAGLGAAVSDGSAEVYTSVYLRKVA